MNDYRIIHRDVKIKLTGQIGTIVHAYRSRHSLMRYQVQFSDGKVFTFIRKNFNYIK